MSGRSTNYFWISGWVATPDRAFIAHPARLVGMRDITWAGPPSFLWPSGVTFRGSDRGLPQVGLRAGHRSEPVSVPPPRPIPCAGPCALAPHPKPRALMLEHLSMERSFACVSRSACRGVHGRVQEFVCATFTAFEFVVGVKLCQRSSSFSVRSDLCGGSTLKFDACRV